MSLTPITIYIVIYKGGKSILYALVVVLLMVGVLVFMRLRIPDRFRISANKNSQMETSKSSPFASFADTAPTKTDNIYTEDFAYALINKGSRVLGITSLPDFTDTIDAWKNILESGQHLAKVECFGGNLKLCNLDFIASTIPGFTSKYYSEISLSRTCPAAGTVYVIENKIFSYNDRISLEPYLEKPIKLIAKFDVADSPFEEDSLPKALECIYYVK